jgi:hypothetical protein
VPKSSRTSPLVAAASALLLLAAPALAAPSSAPFDDGKIDSAVEAAHHQHGHIEGHLPAGSENVDVVGSLDLAPPEGGIADVAVMGNYAYLNAWAPYCPRAGVHIVDISDPAAPKKTGFLRANKNSYPGEGAQVIHVDTKFFKGDLLFVNNEACDSSKPFDGGANIWNVTDPLQPIVVARGVGDWDRIDPRVQRPSSTASQSHSVFAWDAGDKAYMVLVDNEEATDVDILDISQPWAPTMVAEYDLNKRFPQIVQPELGAASSFLHDMVVKNIGGRFVMLLSYWDGGYVTMDVTDPRNATYIADNDFTDPDPEAAESGLTVTPEGNAHQAEFSKDNDYIVAADEDFSPYSVVPRNTTDNTTFQATQGSGTPPIDTDTSMVGDTVFVGMACPGQSVPSAPTTESGSQIALVERGVCTFTEKLATVEAAGGYEGAIVFNRQGSDGCSDLLNMSVEGTIPALFVGRDVGWDLMNIPGYNDAACRVDTQPTPASVALGTVGDAVDVSAIFDGWGYVHLFRNGSSKLVELDTYAVPEAHDPDHAEGSGDLSVHEVAMSAVRNDLAYFSYYAAGFRVAAIENDELVEKGWFIDEGGNNFWGVELWEHGGKEYVLASDRDYGLYIFEYTGD